MKCSKSSDSVWLVVDFFVGALLLTAGSLGMSEDKLLKHCVRDGRVVSFQQSNGFLLSSHVVIDCKLFLGLHFN